jgi:hypothetical protein
VRRREFLSLIAATVATPALCGVMSSMAGDEEEVLRANYEAFRQHLRTLLEDGHDFLHFELRAPRGGFRHASVFTTKGVISWEQPWDGDCI